MLRSRRAEEGWVMASRATKSLLIAGAVIAGAAGVSWAAVALTAPPATNVIFACQKDDNGNADNGGAFLRVVSDPGQCKKNERVISWNVQGPAGAAGPP